MDRITLKAKNGYRFTNGADVHGKIIHLANGMSADGFYEITEEEFALLSQKDGETVSPDEQN